MGSSQFQGLVLPDGRVETEQVAGGTLPPGAIHFRGMALSSAGKVLVTADTGQPRVIVNGIALEAATGIVLYGNAPPTNISHGGLLVDVDGAVVMVAQAPEVIHQGVGLTNAGELCVEQLGCFFIASATIGDPFPDQIDICFNDDFDPVTCIVEGDWSFDTLERGAFDQQNYLSSPTTQCTRWNAKYILESVDGATPTETVRLNYVPGTCKLNGSVDPECDLPAYSNFVVNNQILGYTDLEVGNVANDIVVATFAVDLSTTGTAGNWTVERNGSPEFGTTVNVVGGKLHVQLTSDIVDTDFVTIENSFSFSINSAQGTDGRYVYKFYGEVVTNNVDTTAPSIPQNLVATATGQTSVNLVWDPSTDAKSGMKEYVIYRDSAEIDRVPHPTTTYNDTGLSPETAYSYTVSAVDNKNNESAQSASDSATTWQPAPLVTTAEVGNEAANIVVVNFDREVFASSYAMGWSFTEDTSPLSISSADKEVKPPGAASTVRFTLSADVSEGTTVAYAYNGTTGDYVNADGIAMASDSGVVTNNVSAGADFEAFGADADGVLKALVKGTGSVTFGRATEATVQESSDLDSLVKIALANELRFENARRVQNICSDTEDLTQSTWVAAQKDSPTLSTFIAQFGTIYNRVNVVDDHVYRCRVQLRNIDGNTALHFYHTWGTASITPVTIDATQKVYSVLITCASGQGGSDKPIGIQDRNVGGQGQVEITKIQLEDVTGQTNQNPSEYVSVGVISNGQYHGAMVDGVKYFNYQNGNTVASNIVTEDKGADLTTAWRALFEPAATNYADTDDDLTGGAETVDLTTPGTGNYTLSVAGTAAVTVAAGTATGTGFGQATAGNPVTFNLSAAGTVTLTLNSGTLGTAQDGWYLKQVEKATVNSSFIEAPGGSANRTVDDGVPMFDYANWSQTEGTWHIDFWLSKRALGYQFFATGNSTNQQLYLTNTEKMRSFDGTSVAETTNAVAQAVDNQFRGVLDFGTSSTIEVGCRDVEGAGSFDWDDSPPNYDGAYPTNNVINICFSIPAPIGLRDFKGYVTRQGKAWVEANL